MSVRLDLRHFVRSLAARPLYGVLTVLVFAIALGANATVFSVFNGLLLRPLPYPESDRLVMVYDSYAKMGLPNAGTAIPDYLERREQAASLESLAIVGEVARTLEGEGRPERLRVARASASLFDVLRVSPETGRAFSTDEETLGNDHVVVLSHRLWSTRFGARPDIVGSSIRLDSDSLRVIGVMPVNFGFPSREIDAYVPFAFTPAQASDAARGNQSSVSVGRLKPGATVAGLNAELDAIVRRNVSEGRVQSDAVSLAGFTGRATPLRDLQVGNLKQLLVVLQAIVLVVLLIACANVANLQLTRVASRRKELAVRAALGAGDGRLVRLVLGEALLLALVGVALGVALAAGGLRLVRALGLDRSSDGFEFVLDATVLGFTFGAAIIAALAAGVPPVLALLREDLTSVIRETGRHGGGGRAAQRMRGSLVVVQLALSVALLVGAGLLTKSFYGLLGEGPGFNAGSVWTVRFSLAGPRYAGQDARLAFEQAALAVLRALPGVSAAGFSTVLPFSGITDQGTTIIERYEPPPGTAPPHADHRSIDEGYLPTLGIPVVAGRNFAATEVEPVVIVDETLAAKYWPAGNALGQRLRRDGIGAPDVWYTVVGIVPAVKQSSLAETPIKETIYWHYQQQRRPAAALALRTVLPPADLAGAVTAAIAGIDQDVALYDARTMDERVERSLGVQRTPMVLTLVFAGVAFVLAVVGIYGVLSWAVVQRVGEIGVRMALGANASDIGRMVLTQGGRLIVVGLAAGVAGALALGRVLAAQLPAVESFDSVVVLVTVVALGGAALVASWLPARRAARTEPLVALRGE
jgi:predicted permease